MTTLGELSFLCRSLITFWALLLCAGGAVGTILSVTVRKYRYSALFMLLFSPAYLLWQAAFDFSCFGIDNCSEISAALGNVYPACWVISLALLSFASAYLIWLIKRCISRNITPVSIKKCADNMNCGICYWRENGHVIFANECINSICIALTGKALINGNDFNKAITGSVISVYGKMWKISSKRLKYEGGTLYELIAFDVTEISDKTEALREENEDLTKLNDILKSHNLKIDDTVRRQEILQAKVNIHDEMNRLMLSTVATDSTDTEAMNANFALWQKNALMLCLEAGERKDNNVLERAENLAKELNVQIVWDSEIPDSLTEKQKELLFTALQEAITNAVKHAQAKQMRISFSENESKTKCFFENNGKITNNNIVFTGGLANLQLLAKEQNAEISVTTDGSFILTLCFKNTPIG